MLLTATPAGGTFAEPQSVVLAASETASIYYTLDGTTPTEASPLYSAPLSIGGVTTLKFFGVDGLLVATAVQTEVYTINLPATPPPEAWVTPNNPGLPGSAGAWSSLPAPTPPAAVTSAVVRAIATYQILLDGVDITTKVTSCTIEETESAILSTVSLTMPVGVEVVQGMGLSVLWSTQVRLFIVEEVDGEGPQRTVWGRSSACVLDEPHAAAGSWNAWDNPHTNASDLAATLAGSVPLEWQCADWPLPAVWDLAGTPLAALQSLAAAVGAIVQSTGAGGLVIRNRWTVRPSDIPAETPTIQITRATALALSHKKESGKGWGSITVYGYDPSADLPDLEVEESAPVSGETVHVRLYWQRPAPPVFTADATDGSAAYLDTASRLITAEDVTFENGIASTRYPITALHSYSWIGDDQGLVWQLTGGDRRQLSMAEPGGRGIAYVSYTTTYDRWALTGQTAEKVVFSIDVGTGGIAATVNLTSGGSVAPAINSPLLGSVAACIAAGTAALDDSRAHSVIQTEVPLTATSILPGMLAAVTDQVAGVSGNGKITRVNTIFEAGPKTTRNMEVIVC